MFRQDFAYRNPDPRLERSVAAFKAWFTELDHDLLAAVNDLSEDDIAGRKIIRGDFDVEYFAPLPKQQLDVYREVLLIFYGKVSVYCGRRRPSASSPPRSSCSAALSASGLQVHCSTWRSQPGVG